MKLFLLPVILTAACCLPAHAEIPLGTVAGSEVAFEGLFQVDGYWFDNDIRDLDGRADGRDRATGIRRFEFALKGSGPGGLSWVLGYDVHDENYLDNNLSWSFGDDDLAPTHTLLLGQSKQPNSLEELSSSRNNDFIAKAAATGTYAVGRRLGASWSYDAGGHGATVGWFGRNLDHDVHGAGYGLRAWWAPVREDGRVLHLGLSHVDRDTDGDQLRLRARPNADFAERLIDSGTLSDVDRLATTGFEALWIGGPLKLQGEYFLAAGDRIGTGSYDTGGGYASALWNPGGETWGYRGGLPRTQVGDAGLWQLGLRYDQLDFDDGAVRGGRMEAWTLGVNRYWRKNAKLMLNYVDVASRRTDAASGAVISDDPSIVEARIQLHW